jgi:sugar phosphate isomerase/epimerase
VSKYSRKEKAMKFSLSGRIIEVDYKYCQLSIEEFGEMAGRIGYDAVELRRTQISAATTPDQVKQMRAALDKRGVGVSCLPAGGVKDNESLKELSRLADMAGQLGCRYLSVGFGSTAWARKAADCLEERGLSIAVQTHTGGPFETPAKALKTLKEINRDNFGLTYDPANLFIQRADYVKAVEQLKDHLFMVSVQCLAPAAEDEEGAMEHEGFYYKRHLLSEPGGMDFQAVFDALGKVGFDGYVTVLEPISDLMNNLELAEYSYRQLKKMVSQE